MKPFLFIASIIFFACNDVTKPSRQENADLVTPQKASINKSRFYAPAGTLIIASPHFDTLTYSSETFNEIVDHFPTLYEDIPEPPDISYAQSGYFKDIIDGNGRKKHISFGSEVGQDEYYILYAYFLRKRNTGKDLNERREQLTGIYQSLNDIFGRLNYGGTYFGHMYKRLNGYAEYSVYQYSRNKEFYDRGGNATELKKLYIASLRQIISGAVDADNELQDKAAKENRKQEINKTVDRLNSLITDNFYLKKAQEFHYTKY